MSGRQSEHTPGFVSPDATLNDVSPSGPLPPASGSKKQRKKASRIDQIADQLSRRASGSLPGQRRELGRKRPLDEDKEVANTSHTRQHFLAKSPGHRQHNEQLVSESKQQPSPPLVDLELVLGCAPLTRNAALRTSPRKSDLNSDELVPETPQKEATAVQGHDPALCNIQALLEVRPGGETQPAPGAGGLSTPSKSNSPSQRRSPRGKALLSPGVRKSPRLVQRELERTRPRVSTRTECVRRFGPPSRDSLVVSFDLATLGAVRRAGTPQKSSVCGTSETPPTHLRTCRTNEDVTPEVRLQGVAPSRLRSALMGQNSSEPGSDFMGFSPNSVKTALTDFLARSAGMVTRSMAAVEGPASGERRIDEIALRLIAAVESKSLTGTRATGSGKRCLEFDDASSSPPAKRRRVNPSEASQTGSANDSRRSPRLLKQQVFSL